ncbi:MAG: alanine--tRNA ligase [Candidatus Magnetoovum sp. WYHC-5]|nr:alanine--tRNA ligase [Candidatus Magnetoovum sp. WYHC-5]
MKSKEVRERFISFFQSKNHEIVKSSSLLPVGDNTLLFTNAGMVQFKSVFLGLENRLEKRAATCQKCVRAGGKHNDLDNIGYTARHHSFFEMLGNFSFGDYFKKEAIEYAWQLLTQHFGLPKDKMWVTVYEDDDEAVSLWLNHTEMPKDRIVRMGAKDNFWQMGDTGPCGPCSEILIDQGEAVGCGRPQCAVGCDCDRFLEIWNLVFMQYDRKEDGTLLPLPSPSIDTGMGLERICAILQGKLNNYDTDIFETIIKAITQKTGVSYNAQHSTDVSIRVIADHIRAITFLLSEGLLPSNEGRGYVLRRIIRRASRHARMLGVSAPFLHTLVEPCVESYSDLYLELAKDINSVKRTVLFEEERFAKTLDKGLEMLDGIISSATKTNINVIPGEEIFKLYDTYGFPPDITKDIARERGLITDDDGFNREMENQKIRGKASWVEESGSADALALYSNIAANSGQTLFCGYDTMERQATVVAIIQNGGIVNHVKEGERAELILDATPFYAESGGQVGDTGLVSTNTANASVLDTKKMSNNIHVHYVQVEKGAFTPNSTILCHINEAVRRSTMRNHTATHMLHAALRNVLGEHVKQAGSLVTSERLRFDFTHFLPVGANERYIIEDMVNAKILANLPVKTTIMDFDEAVQTGAMALFDEKYGAQVRVVEIGDYSKELCGGTHCSFSGEIGGFYVLSESSIASGVRRIEAVTGTAFLEIFRRQGEELKAIAEILKTENSLDKLQTMVKQMKDVEKELERLKQKDMVKDITEIIDSAIKVQGVNVLSIRKDGLEQKELRSFSDILRERLGSGIIFIVSVKDEQANFILLVTKELTKRFDAGKLLKKVAAIAGGRGGGKANMAQGGTKDIDKVDGALSSFIDIIKS